MEECLTELKHKLQQSLQKCDKLDCENKSLFKEINDEKDRQSIINDKCSTLQIQLKNLQDNYDRLKYACSITDTQLTEIETMLEKEQKCNKTHQEKLDRMHADARLKDKLEAELKQQLREEELKTHNAELKISSLINELDECRSSLEILQNKFSNQQQDVIEQTNNLFVTQEKLEVLQHEHQNIQVVNKNQERELILLKEENARILSDLFLAKEESQQLQQNLKDVYSQNTDLQNETQDLKRLLEEKENFFLQRDIKSEATLAQHKKLIDYLQLKVEDLTLKKKKTLADKIFGSNGNSNKKENIGPSNIETSILYRTLQEELRREKLKSRTLQEQLDKLRDNRISVNIRSPLKSKENHSKTVDSSIAVNSVGFQTKSPKKKQVLGISEKCASPQKKTSTEGIETATPKHLQSHHRFELALQETNIENILCVACNNPIVAGAAYWKCKECKNSAHRKCRSDVKQACENVEEVLARSATSQCVETIDRKASAPMDSVTDSESIGNFSYEGKLDTPADANVGDNCLTTANSYQGTLIFSISENYTENPIEVVCAYEMEENRILLLGCNSGLYALHIEEHKLIPIAGVDAVSCIAISKPLAKVIMVGSNGDSLYQCDLRHLQSRSQASACLKPALEASVLDLPFSNRTSTEKWKLVQISEETEQPLDTIAIGATTTRIVILKYDLKQQKFKPVRALDTATPVSSIFYTRHTAIVSSDKFFEIDLSTYGAEEFVDIADQTLTHTHNCQPVVALRISKQELLLCFMECGIFVDEYGCRSRPYDINWEYTPCGFLYRAPFLYVAHFQSMQIIRLHRSYTNEITLPSNRKHIDDDSGGTNSLPHLKRSYIPFYMPTILAESGKFNAFMLATQKTSGLQEIYHLDALQTFRQQHNESIDTISSIATSITMGSVNAITD